MPWECIFQETEVTLNKSHIEHGGAFTNCYNCIVVNSRVSSDNFYNCTFNNTSITCRGEFKCNKIINSSLSFVNADNFTIENCQFENLKWAISCSEVNVTIINCHFINISSTAVGSLRDSKSGNLNLSNCEFLNCNGAIRWMGDSISLKNCSFINTKDRILYLIVNNGIIDNCTFMNYSSNYPAIDWTGFPHFMYYDKNRKDDVYSDYSFNCTLINSNFIDMACEDFFIHACSVNLDIGNCSFKNVSVKGYYPSIIYFSHLSYIEVIKQSASISECEFTNCKGNLYLEASKVIISNISLNNGSTVLTIYSPNADIANSTFSNINVKSIDYGALYLGGLKIQKYLIVSL